MAQQHRIGKGNTSVRGDGKTMVVRFHNTDVVKFSPKTITLNTGGWETATTKTRMNQASNQFGLGYTVTQKDFSWYVHYKGKVMKFKGNKLTFRR